MGNGTADILVIEDNLGDQRLIREALRESRAMLHFVQDGEEALRFLRRDGRFKTSRAPSIILMDLNLPKLSGREVLGEIKSDPELRCIPVVIFTSSRSEQDVLHAYNCHANCYVTKPVDLDGFMEAMRSIESFWLSVAQLPPPAQPLKKDSD